MNLQWKTNRKSYMAYRMVQIPMTFSEFEGHFCNCYTSDKTRRTVPLHVQSFLF